MVKNPEKLKKSAVVLVNGFGDPEVCLIKLYKLLKSTFGRESIHYFRYNYNCQEGEPEILADIDILENRFYQFLKDNGLLDKNISLNVIGYSLGGIIILYSAGKHRDLLDNIRKYISIASPHDGAFGDMMQNLFNLFKLFLGIELNSNDRPLFQLCTTDADFMKKIYPETVAPTFKKLSKSNMLQIWSPHDGLAQPDSCLKFVREGYMQDYMVEYVQSLNPVPFAFPVNVHINIARETKVIDKIIEFIKE